MKPPLSVPPTYKLALLVQNQACFSIHTKVIAILSDIGNRKLQAFNQKSAHKERKGGNQWSLPPSRCLFNLKSVPIQKKKKLYHKNEAKYSRVPNRSPCVFILFWLFSPACVSYLGLCV